MILHGKRRIRYTAVKACIVCIGGRGAETGKMVTYEQARGREKTAGRLFLYDGHARVLW